MPKIIKVASIRTDRITDHMVERYSDADVLTILTEKYSRVSIKDELSGRSEDLLSLGRITSPCKGLSFVSLVTDNFGYRRRSVAVFDKGKLVRIADAVNGQKGFSPSFGFKTVSAGELKFGIAVGKDLCDRQCLNCFDLIECDAIINLSGDFYDFSTENLVATLSYIYGVNIVSANSDKTVAACSGRLVLSTKAAESEVSLILRKNFSDVTVRRKGPV